MYYESLNLVAQVCGFIFKNLKTQMNCHSLELVTTAKVNVEGRQKKFDLIQYSHSFSLFNRASREQHNKAEFPNKKSSQ